MNKSETDFGQRQFDPKTFKSEVGLGLIESHLFRSEPGFTPVKLYGWVSEVGFGLKMTFT
jgi:hypothetical protein